MPPACATDRNAPAQWPGAYAPLDEDGAKEDDDKEDGQELGDEKRVVVHPIDNHLQIDARTSVFQRRKLECCAAASHSLNSHAMLICEVMCKRSRLRTVGRDRTRWAHTFMTMRSDEAITRKAMKIRCFSSGLNMLADCGCIATYPSCCLAPRTGVPD